MYTSKVKKNADKPRKMEILSVAREMLLHDGIDNLSMRHIASTIGCSPTTIYTYFRNKEEIIFRLCDEVYGQIKEIFLDVIDNDSTPLENIKNCMYAYVNYALNNGDRYRIAFMTHRDGVISTFLKGKHQGTELFEIFRNIVAKISDEPCKMAQALWCLIHGIVSNLLMNTQFPWIDKDELVSFAIDKISICVLGGGK